MYMSLYLRSGVTRFRGWHGSRCGCKAVTGEGFRFRLSRSMTVDSSRSKDNNLATSTTSPDFLPGFPDEWKQKFLGSFKVMNDFVNEEEEVSIMKEVEPHLKRMMYEKDHWDEVISA